MSSFYDIIGQQTAVNFLQGAIREKRVSHAYIFDGQPMSGKRTLARIFAETLLCEEGGDNPCGHCHSCAMAKSGNHPDIITVSHEKPATLSVGEIRQQLVGDIGIKPYTGRKKVYIVPDASLMNPQAQNALLKTLEEPPHYAVIILLTDNEMKLLPTLRSRSVTLKMRPVSEKLIEDYLKNKGEISERQAKIAAAFSGGSLGRAKALIEDEAFEGLKNEILRVVEGITKFSFTDINDSIKKASEYKDRINDYLDMLLLFMRDVLYTKAAGDDAKIVFSGEELLIGTKAKTMSYEKINTVMEEINTVRSRLTSNVNFDMTMELLFLTMKGNRENG
ncbi:DNA polymerase III subunit delta' [Lachnospiraceae bacterium C1.1]|nr:DNA polymerase III subunit delta' [Lachnospiraceae bacterium C1.1]